MINSIADAGKDLMRAISEHVCLLGSHFDKKAEPPAGIDT